MRREQQAADGSDADGEESGAWWTGRPSGSRLRLYRVVCGLLLASYFGVQTIELPFVLGVQGLLDSELLSRLRPAHHATLLQPSLGPWVVRLVCLVGCLASLSVSAGRWTRSAAAVTFCVALSIQRAVHPIATSEDYMVCWVAFWLMLLPAPSKTEAPSPFSLAVVLMLAGLLCLYVGTPLWRPTGVTSPLWVFLATIAVPVLYVFPLAPARYVAALGQLALHGFLALEMGLWVGNALAAATVILLVDRRVVSPSLQPVSAPLGGVDALAVVFTFTSLLAIVGGNPWLPWLGMAPRALLGDVGLPLPERGPTPTDVDMEYALGLAPLAPLSASGLWPTRGPRLQRLWVYMLGAPEGRVPDGEVTGGERLRQGTRARLALRLCAGATEGTPLVVYGKLPGDSNLRSMRFSCGSAPYYARSSTGP